MDAGYISALAGSAIGALSSFATTRVIQHSQRRATQRAEARARCEALYGDFIREASRLFGDAFQHELADPAKLVQLYAIVSTIRVFRHLHVRSLRSCQLGFRRAHGLSLVRGECQSWTTTTLPSAP